MLNSMLGEADAPDWGLAFHAQQAVEKSMKAVLACRSIEFPFSHDLSLLLDVLRKSNLPLPPDAEDLDRLSPFGTLMRYSAPVKPMPKLAPNREWMQASVRRTMEWAETLLAKP
jgi:HEPN domain-containing protein